MNILEKYSTTCGTKIKEPYVAHSYFPMHLDKYIVIDNRNRNIFNTYDLYDDVISYIYPTLIENGIGIIDFAINERRILPKTHPYIQLSKKQEAYILKNSLLNICSDNYSSYISECFNVPSIGLYSTMPSSVTKPYWNKNHTVLESSRLGNLPSYFDAETPKCINFISPEEITNEIFKILNINKKIENKTIYTGNYYAIKLIEVIPDFIPDKNYLTGKSINVRMDYCFDEKILQYWLSDRFSNILTNKQIDVRILEHFKQNIAQFTVDINDSFDSEYLKMVQEAGINLKIFCSDVEKINQYRIKFFDFEIEESIFKSKKDFLDAYKEVNSNLKFLSSKILISRGKKYSCKASLDKDIELGSSFEDVIDDKVFWDDLDYYRIIEI